LPLLLLVVVVVGSISSSWLLAPYLLQLWLGK
jgi:hypothetical protein